MSWRGSGFQLQLPYPASPEYAARFAEDAAAAFAEGEGVILDYSPKSISEIDRVIESLRTDGLTSGAMAETLFLLACYVGEVMVRNLDATWATGKDVLPRRARKHFPPLVVLMPSGAVWSPFSKAVKALDNGIETDGLVALYEVAAANR